MLKAVLKEGEIVPLEPMPSEWHDGVILEIAVAESTDVDIDAWASAMNRLCSDSSADDEETMRRAIDEQRRQAKERTRRDMGLSA